MYLKYNSLANVQRIDYTQYTIQNTLMLYAVCEVFSVFAIHYTGYIIIYSRSGGEDYETHRHDR